MVKFKENVYPTIYDIADDDDDDHTRLMKKEVGK